MLQPVYAARGPSIERRAVPASHDDSQAVAACPTIHPADKPQRSGVWQPSRVLPPSVVARLARLTPDQRDAATAPPGPVLCVAPAGSGKTTTLVARIAWLVATGADPSTITAVTFNKRAADEMAAPVDAALEPLALAAGAVRVKTFHALGREILADSGVRVEPPLDREAVLRDMWPDITPGVVRRLDDAFSRLKLEIGVTAREVATDAEPGPIARTFLADESALDDAGGLDFDDLVARALRLLEARPPLLRRWRAKCEHLLVDETQDVDRSQLRLALLLAAPANRIFLVGDDDQTTSKSLSVSRSFRSVSAAWNQMEALLLVLERLLVVRLGLPHVRDARFADWVTGQRV